jgi:hypothetical protein
LCHHQEIRAAQARILRTLDEFLDLVIAELIDFYGV